MIISIIIGIIIGCYETRDNLFPSSSKDNFTVDNSKITIFFSQTKGSLYSATGVDGDIIKSIDGAKKNIRVAIYEFSNDNIRDAFIRAKKRGINIKIVTDDKKIDQEDIVTLKRAGIKITSDNRSSALMHNKFMIIDNKIVWSGSANYSYYAFYRHNENIIKIESLDIAKVYLEEFNQLLSHKLSKHRYIKKNIKIYFSPKEKFENIIIDLLKNAKKKIHFLAFSFTSKPIAGMLQKKYQEGLEIKGVFDKSQNKAQKSSRYEYLKNNNMDVRIDGGGGKLHSKVFIIDDNIVITGSYNFSSAANKKNNENSIVIYDDNIAKKYEQEFKKIYQIAN